jgi:hypothetical protein
MIFQQQIKGKAVVMYTASIGNTDVLLLPIKVAAYCLFELLL